MKKNNFRTTKRGLYEFEQILKLKEDKKSSFPDFVPFRFLNEKLFIRYLFVKPRCLEYLVQISFAGQKFVLSGLKPSLISKIMIQFQKNSAMIFFDILHILQENPEEF